MSQILPSLNICFALDTTGSMSIYINQLLKSIENLINSKASHTFKFAVCAYRDHGDSYTTK